MAPRLCIQIVVPFIKHSADAVAVVPITEAISLKIRGDLVNKSYCLIFLYCLDGIPTQQEMK